MATLGTIKEVNTVDGQHTVIVETGSGPAVTATIMQGGGADFQPLPGDRAVYHYAGSEVVISAVFSEDAQSAPGEWIVLSRSSADTVTGFFKISPNGQFNANDNWTVDP